jgi:GNAT superfamily N-acetyltransferase
MTGLSSGFTNGVLRTSLAPEDVPEMVAETRAWFHAGLSWRWMVGATSTPADLADRLGSAGFDQVRPPMPAMAVELDSLDLDDRSPAGGTIREVATADDVEAWIGVRSVRHPMDDPTIRAWQHTHAETPFGPSGDLRLFIGHLHGRAVAVAAAHLDPRTATAGIYAVDVVPDARGQGFGRAVTGAALVAARERGYPLAVLTATPLGRLLYLRMGFRIVGEVAVFVGAT